MVVSFNSVMAELRLANNGYTFASNLHPDYVRRAHQLVARKVAFTCKLKNTFGILEDVFFVSEQCMKSTLNSLS